MRADRDDGRDTPDPAEPAGRSLAVVVDCDRCPARGPGCPTCVIGLLTSLGPQPGAAPDDVRRRLLPALGPRSVEWWATGNLLAAGLLSAAAPASV